MRELEGIEENNRNERKKKENEGKKLLLAQKPTRQHRLRKPRNCSKAGLGRALVKRSVRLSVLGTQPTVTVLSSVRL